MNRRYIHFALAILMSLVSLSVCQAQIWLIHSKPDKRFIEVQKWNNFKATYMKVLDVSGDGFDDLITCYDSPRSKRAFIHFYELTNNQMSVVWRYFHRPGYFSLPSSFDLEGDGNLDYFIGFKDSSSISLLHFDEFGARPKTHKFFDKPDLVHPIHGWTGNLEVYDYPLDLNQDGSMDILIEFSAGFCRSPRGLMGFSPSDGKVLWYFPVPGPLSIEVMEFSHDTLIYLSSAAVSNGRTVMFDPSGTYAFGSVGSESTADKLYQSDIVAISAVQKKAKFMDWRSYVICINTAGKLIWQREFYKGHSWASLIKRNVADSLELYTYDRSVPNVVQNTKQRISQIDPFTGRLLDSLVIRNELLVIEYINDLENWFLFYDTTNGDVYKYNFELELERKYNLEHPISWITLLSGHRRQNSLLYKVIYKHGEKTRLYESGFEDYIELEEDDKFATVYLARTDSLSQMMLKRGQDEEEFTYVSYADGPGYLEFYHWYGLFPIPFITVFLFAFIGYRALPPLLSPTKADAVIDRQGVLRFVSQEMIRRFKLPENALRMNYKSLFASGNLQLLQTKIEQVFDLVIDGDFSSHSFEFDYIGSIDDSITIQRMMAHILPVKNKLRYGQNFIMISITDITCEYQFELLSAAHNALFHVAHSSKNLAVIARAEFEQVMELLKTRKSDVSKSELDRLDKALDYINNVIDINYKAISRSRISRKQLFYKDEPQYATDFVNEIFAIIKETYGTRVELSQNDLPEIQIEINRQLMREVINSLIENAIEASPSHKKVIVYVNPNSDDKEYLNITVKDFGGGISKEDVTRIFNPTFTTKEVTGGTGLGLSRALVIVSYHGGYISFQSKISEGSEFNINIPIT